VLLYITFELIFSVFSLSGTASRAQGSLFVFDLEKRAWTASPSPEDILPSVRLERLDRRYITFSWNRSLFVFDSEKRAWTASLFLEEQLVLAKMVDFGQAVMVQNHHTLFSQHQREGIDRS